MSSKRYTQKEIDKKVSEILDRVIVVNEFDYFMYQIDDIYIYDDSGLDNSDGKHGPLGVVLITSKKDGYIGDEYHERDDRGIWSRYYSMEEDYELGIINYKNKPSSSILGMLSYDFYLPYRYIKQKWRTVALAKWDDLLENAEHVNNVKHIYNMDKGNLNNPKWIEKSKAFKHLL